MYEFKCPLCNRSIRFRTVREFIEKLEQHFNEEHPQYKNTCLICNTTYMNTNNLYQHLTLRHTIQYSEQEALIKCLQHILLTKGGRKSTVIDACMGLLRKYIKEVPED